MLRGGSATFRDLKGHTLSVAEKEWLCDEVLGKNPEHSFPCATKRGLVRRYNLYDDFFRRNMPSYLHYEHCLPGHHPEAIEPAIRDTIRNHVQEAQNNRNTVTDTQLRKILQKGITVSNGRKRSNSEMSIAIASSAVIDISEADKLCVTAEYRRRYCEREQIAIGRPDKTTVARDNACKCPFSSYVWFILLEAVSSKLPASHKWNADSTTYPFESAEYNETVAFVKNAPGTLQKQHKPRKVMLDNNLCLNVKVMFMCNANGDFSDLVTIISIPTLDSGQWHVENVTGLSNKPGPNSGYIYFCQTRAGNDEMWQHWFRTIALPTLNMYTNHYCLIQQRLPQAYTRTSYSTECFFPLETP